MSIPIPDNVADLEPGIAPVNAELGPMYALQEALGDRMATFSRQNILPMRAGIGSWIMGANPNHLRHVIGAIGGVAIDDPRVLSRAAIQARPFGQSLQQGAQRVRAMSSGLTPLAEAGQATEEAMRAALLSQLNGSTEKP